VPSEIAVSSKSPVDEERELLRLLLEKEGVHAPDREIHPAKPEIAVSSKSSVDEERELLRLLLEKEGVHAPDQEIHPAKPPERLPLSYAQKRLWFIDQLVPGSDLYNVALTCELRGALNIPALERSLQEIVRRHGALRTRFVVEDGEPLQKIEPSVELRLQLLDVRDQKSVDAREQAVKILAAAGAKPFNLESAPLLRAALVRMGDQQYAFGLTIHHIVVDEWSLEVLMQEMATLYSAYAQGLPSPLKTMPVQYADYTLWQSGWLRDELFTRQMDYWKRQLSGMPQVLELPTDKSRPLISQHRGSAESRSINRDLWETLKQSSRQQGASMFMTLLAVFEVLLLRYTGQSDFGVGTPVTNRHHLRMEGVIGFCLNTLVIRADLNHRPSFRQVLKRVIETALDGFSHQDMPLEKLVEELSPARSLSHTPLFQVMFTCRSDTRSGIRTEITEQTSFSLGPGVEMHPLEQQAATAKSDLAFMAGETDCLLVALNYDTELFEPHTIQRMLHHYECLLAAAAADLDINIWDMPMLTPPEIQQLLVEWNQPAAECEQKLIHELFEAQVETSPDSIAVQCNDHQFTYRDLNRRANRLAHRLRKLGVGAEVRVGLCVERGLEMVAAMLGILKSGGAYVPLDPAYPQERLKFTVEDAAIGALVTQSALSDRLPEQRTPVIFLDSGLDELARESDENVAVQIDSRNLAYVIYTSGSTGKPKGVAIEHGSASALLHWTREIFSAEELSSTLSSASICFDLSIFEIFAPLSWGGKTILARNALSLAEMEPGLNASLLNTVPSAMAELLRIKGVPNSVTTVNLGGETLPPSTVAQLYAETKIKRVFNLYGPSEDTTCSTWACLKREDANGRVPIGKPISKTQAHVLDSEYQLIPSGCAGELYLGGQGLARGYLHRPDLTAERFLPNPFSSSSGARIYRTGDQVKWRRDGNLEFLRRLDHQVKLRGYRIELGEIEAALEKHLGISACAVTVREDDPGDPRLVAYVVKAPQVEQAELKEFLKNSLPDYMIPSCFVSLEKLPLTLNGKVDRQALPAPADRRTEIPGYVDPRNGEEEILCGLFAEVLKIERVGVHDNFFAVGGHSLLATRLVSRIRETMGVDVELRSVFESPTVAELTPRVGARTGSKLHQMTALRSQPRPHLLPASYAQQRIWFEHRLHGHNTKYNLVEAIRLRGELNGRALAGTLAAIVEKQEALRTHFAEAEDGLLVQVIDPQLQIELALEDLSACDDGARQERIAASIRTEHEYQFDLSQGPLLRMRLLQLNRQDHILLRNCHHIVCDPWSVGIFNRELFAGYEALQEGRAIPSEPLPIQYADFALWQRQRMEEDGAAHLDYWKKQLAGIPRELALPLDHARTVPENVQAEVCETHLPPELAASLKGLGQQNQATLYLTLLSAFALLLHHYSGQDDIVVASPVAGRPDAQLENVMGLFSNQLPLRVRIDEATPFNALLAQVRGTALDAHSHQDLPFACLLEKLFPAYPLNTNPTSQVMFTWHYMLREMDAFPGLQLEPVEGMRPQIHYDLELHAVERAGAAHFQWIYNSSLFDRRRVEQMAEQYKQLLRTVVAMPNQTLRQLLPSHLPARSPEQFLPEAVMKNHLEEEQELVLRMLQSEGLASATAAVATQEVEVIPPTESEEYEASQTAIEEYLAATLADVLGLQRVGIHDNFFTLGGGSLCAAVIAARIEAALAIEFPIRIIFESPTVAELAKIIEPKLNGREFCPKLREVDMPQVAGHEAISPAALFPLSCAQEQLWFLDRLQPGSDFYNVALAWRIKGELNILLLEHCLNKVMCRHEALRTCFVLAPNGIPRQKIAPDDLEVSLERFDLTEVDPSQKERQAKKILAQSAGKPFNLTEAPLLRGVIIRLGEREHILGLTLHHIVCDHWSFGILWEELSTLYGVYETGQASPLPELGMQYKDYALQQKEWMRGTKFREQMEFWKQYLTGVPQVINLPTDRPRPHTQTFRGQIVLRDMPDGLLESLRKLSRLEKTSLFMTLLAACQVLLMRHSGQEDFAVGTVIANRNQTETQRLIGFFLSTLVIRANLQGQPTFRQVLRRVRESSLDAFANQEVPFEKLVEELAPNRDVSRTPLFQVAFTLISTPTARLELGSSEVSQMPVELDSAKFDLTMVIDEGNESAGVALNYNSDLFEAATIRRMLEHYERLLEAIVADADQPVWTLPMNRTSGTDLPRNASDAADVAVFPALGAERVSRALVLPRTELEQAIASAWQAVLGIDQVSVHDNFFDLGGYSLAAVQLLLRLQNELGLDLELLHLFQFPTIDSLVHFLHTGYNFEVKLRGTRERAGRQKSAVQKLRKEHTPWQKTHSME
jgi:amino acid adenylation domain-containing protein